MGLNCFGISFSSPNITLDSDPTHQKLSKSGYHAIWKEWKENAVPGEGEQRGIAVERMKYWSLSIILCNCHRIKGDRSGGHRTR